MTDKKRGIVDPWRKVEPLVRQPAAAPSVGKRDLDDNEWRDEDLAIPGKYVIRSRHVSLDITSTRVQVPANALEVLAVCILELGESKNVGVALLNAGIGARLGSDEFNPPPEERPAARLDAREATVWFHAQTYDQGMLKLGRILRHGAALPIARKHGIVPMLKT